jgi:hypothetical protein
MGDQGPPICVVCRRQRGVDEGGVAICEAYPQGIPPEIRLSEVDHRRAYGGDGGLTFAPVDDRADQYADAVFRGRPDDVSAPADAGRATMAARDGGG